MRYQSMISVVIPTMNSERQGFGATLSALVAAVVDGLVREVIVVDGGSTDHTLAIADEAGCEILTTEPNRVRQLRAGVAKSRFPWLMILNPDTELEVGWHHEVAQLIERVANKRRPPCAAVFRFTLDEDGTTPRAIERAAQAATSFFKLPQPEQGLLIERALYDEVGGYRDLPLFEDIDLVHRVGQQRVTLLRSRSILSAGRYRESGYLKRMVTNQFCLALFVAGVSPERLQRYSCDKRTQEPVETPVSVT